MQVARNIYAPLVSNFLDGKPQGMIAEEWKVDSTGKRWRFKIRRGLTFEDGTPITPQVVLQNFRRIVWLTRNDGLVLNSLMPEVASWKSYDAPLSSIFLEKGDLVFKFSKRPINLFEAISQAIYGIANPKCFDEKGTWRDPMETCSSGPYRIKQITDNKVVLQAREVGYPRLKDAPDTVEIHAPTKAGDNVVRALLDGRGDLTVEHSFGISRRTLSDIAEAGLRIVEEPPVRMHFVHLNHGRGPFANKALRQSFRDYFLRLISDDREYAASGIAVDSSFIPKGGVGYLQFRIPDSPAPRKEGPDQVEVLFFPISADAQIQHSIEGCVVRALKAHGLAPHVTRYPDRFEAFNRMRRGDFDLIVRGTGIAVNNPYGDFRLMFMSKLGALIPDPSGEIPALIEKAEDEESPTERARIAEKINALIYGESAIVTFAHSNLIYIHSPKVDLSRIDLFFDPIEFRAVGWAPARKAD
ncbi:MAG: ABC transporter substrate-binding protein [Elusimicrobiota bacterium]